MPISFIRSAGELQGATPLKSLNATVWKLSLQKILVFPCGSYLYPSSRILIQPLPAVFSVRILVHSFAAASASVPDRSICKEKGYAATLSVCLVDWVPTSYINEGYEKCHSVRLCTHRPPFKSWCAHSFSAYSTSTGIRSCQPLIPCLGILNVIFL